jgi:5'-nucleotidase
MTKSNSESSKNMTELLETLLSSVSSTLKAPVCKSSVMIDLRSRVIRLGESAAGNWFADVIRHAYDDTLSVKGCGGADGVLICAGTLRGDSSYGPGQTLPIGLMQHRTYHRAGNITLGEILEILPFEDPVVVLELDGEALWGALEDGLGKWPALEG